MKFSRTSIAVLAITLIMSVTSCQNNEYPDLGDGLYGEIVTNKGTIVVKLTPEKTPVTVANFVALAEGNHPMITDSLKGKPFYNGILFHRVMNDFMIQAGDLTATGSGSPGYRFGDEFDESLKHDRPGILSMANPGPNSNGSQFFITEVPTPWLDNKHSVFGEVVVGLEIQDSISNVEVGPGNRPVSDVVIEQLNIIRQGFDARNFDAVQVWEKELPLLEEKRKKKEEEAQKLHEEQRKATEEKATNAAAEILPSFNEYKAKTTASSTGLLTYTITKGNGAQPTQGQSVTVYYEGYFTDGKLFDSNVREVEERYGKLNPQKEERGMYNPMPMAISPEAQIISGFKEGVASMSVGDKAFFYIPAHLAYGETGRGTIQPNTDLIFIIELIEITQ